MKTINWSSPENTKRLYKKMEGKSDIKDKREKKKRTI